MLSSAANLPSETWFSASATASASGSATASGSALIDVDGSAGVIRVLVVVAVFAVASAVIRRLTGLGDGRSEVIAASRATVQLGVAGLLISAVLGSWWLTTAFVLLMLTVAALTSAGRMRASGRGWVFAPVALGAVPVTAALIGCGLLPAEPISVIPTAGILIGNAMTATTLAGRRGLEALQERRGEFEAALSLGLLDRDAAVLVCREPAALALVPGLDQTRTVGLVTLPGAFVGTLLGGASPVQAAALQLVVLAGVLVAQSIAVALTLELVVRARIARPASP